MIIVALAVSCGDSSKEGARVSGAGEHAYIDSSDFSDVSIEGAGHRVVIKSVARIGNLKISGSSHDITIKPLAKVRTVVLSGAGHTIYYPHGMNFGTKTSGAGHEFISY